MINLYDIAYGFALAASAPVWGLRTKARRKVMRALRERMGDVPHRDDASPAVMVHAVSLGEMNATRAMIDELRRRNPGLRYIISTTTDTGFARAQVLYGTADDVTLIRFPLDFTRAISRLLDRLRPSVVVLMELELWPNFLRQCEQRNIAVLLANGRLTESSFRKYRLVRPIAKKMLSRVARVCAQDELYARRFVALGAASDRVRVIGTMKFDNVTIGEHVEGADALAREMGLDRSSKIWLCGSTGPGEESIILAVHRSLIEEVDATLRLVIVPRHPERFDEVAALILAHGFALIRRSNPGATPASAVILGDTMGELRKFYSLADVVFVGRSLVDLGSRQHGSDMIEPAALGKAVIVGPFTGNFAEAMRKFHAADAVREVRDQPELLATVRALLNDSADASEMGRRARAIVQAEQGATVKHVNEIVALLDRN